MKETFPSQDSAAAPSSGSKSNMSNTTSKQKSEMPAPTGRPDPTEAAQANNEEENEEIYTDTYIGRMPANPGTIIIYHTGILDGSAMDRLLPLPKNRKRLQVVEGKDGESKRVKMVGDDKASKDEKVMAAMKEYGGINEAENHARAFMEKTKEEPVRRRVMARLAGYVSDNMNENGYSDESDDDGDGEEDREPPSHGDEDGRDQQESGNGGDPDLDGPEVDGHGSDTEEDIEDDEDYDGNEIAVAHAKSSSKEEEEKTDQEIDDGAENLLKAIKAVKVKSPQSPSNGEASGDQPHRRSTPQKRTGWIEQETETRKVGVDKKPEESEENIIPEGTRRPSAWRNMTPAPTVNQRKKSMAPREPTRGRKASRQATPRTTGGDHGRGRNRTDAIDIEDDDEMDEVEEKRENRFRKGDAKTGRKKEVRRRSETFPNL